uniref:hypothetical protein n=1 Tax=Okeania sp. SIO2F4 TaxID=2607790 RepID=UPI0025EFCF1A|nr:hypothetical protein [Okeania sp. SIO2F4]
MPDLKGFVEHYLKGEILAEDLVKNLYVLYEEPSNSLWKKKLAPWFRYPHKCMYDTFSLIIIMSNLGFTSCSKQPFESEIPNIKNIELEEQTKRVSVNKILNSCVGWVRRTLYIKLDSPLYDAP